MGVLGRLCNGSVGSTPVCARLWDQTTFPGSWLLESIFWGSCLWLHMEYETCWGTLGTVVTVMTVMTVNTVLTGVGTVVKAPPLLPSTWKRLHFQCLMIDWLIDIWYMIDWLISWWLIDWWLIDWLMTDDWWMIDQLWLIDWLIIINWLIIDYMDDYILIDYWLLVD